MTIAQRRTIRARYAFRCGYCGLSETDIGAELTIDHFQPRSRGGSDNSENLVYACHACNEFKGDWWPPEDTLNVLRLLHPLRDDLSAHLEENNDGTLRGLTPAGENFIARLRLNRRLYAPIAAPTMSTKMRAANNRNYCSDCNVSKIKCNR